MIDAGGLTAGVALCAKLVGCPVVGATHCGSIRCRTPLLPFDYVTELGGGATVPQVASGVIVSDVDNFAKGKPPAGLARRLAAYAVDAALLFVAVALLLGGALGLILYLTVGFGWARSGPLLWAYVFVTVSIPFWLYYTLSEGGARQATPGMRLLGLRVCAVDGGRVGFGRALLRTVVKLVPFEVNHAVMFLPTPLLNETEPDFRYGFIAVGALMTAYLACVVVTRRGQSVHDLVAGTLVVRDR